MKGLTKEFRVKKADNYDWENDEMITRFYPEFKYENEDGTRIFVRLADDENEVGFVCADTKEDARELALQYIEENIDRFV